MFSVSFNDLPIVIRVALLYSSFVKCRLRMKSKKKIFNFFPYSMFPLFETFFGCHVNFLIFFSPSVAHKNVKRVCALEDFVKKGQEIYVCRAQVMITTKEIFSAVLQKAV